MPSILRLFHCSFLTALLVLATAGLAVAETAGDDAARRLNAAVPNLRITVDERLGVAGHIASPSSFLTGADGGGGAVPKEAAATRAVAGVHHPVRVFIDRYPELFGGDATILDEATVERDDETAHSGLRTLVWQQRLDGIPIHRGLLTANLSPRGELIAIGSHFVPHLTKAATAVAGRQALTTAPPRNASAALAAALMEFGVASDHIVETATGKGLTGDHLLTADGVRGNARAHLVWHALSADDLRLSWVFILVLRKDGKMYELVVDAQDLRIHYRETRTSPGPFNPKRIGAGAGGAPKPAAPQQVVPPRAALPMPMPVATTKAVSKAADFIHLNVFTGDSPRPLSPGWPNDVGQLQPGVASRTLVQLTSIDATASPNGWIDANKETRGNNVDAHSDLNDDDAADTPRPPGTGSNPVTFDFGLNLAQDPSTYTNAAITNLFYWCNVAHDRFYQLGFTEAAGNFQAQRNPGVTAGAAGSDAVQAQAQDGGGTNNANFSTPPDGSPGVMQMYVFTGTTPNRDGDLDATIILHEYGHGVSTRLVGGGGAGNMSALQSRGMGEGWSDFYALSLLSQPGDDPTGTYAVGSYVTEDYFRGIRRHPYCIEPGVAVTASSTNPLTFSDIALNSEVHDQGEVWCMMLWEARGELIARYGATTGNELMLRLVTDGLKLTPANPTFVAARDAILQADATANGSTNHPELWRAFAKRGLGFGAVAGASSTTSGAQESFDTSDQFRVSNPAGLLAGGPPGGPFTPNSVSFTLTNPYNSPITWTATKNRTWVSVSPSTSSISARGTATVTVSIDSSATSLTEGTWRDTVTFTDVTHGVTIVRPVALKVLANYTVTTDTFAWIDPTAHTAIALGDDSLSTARALSFPFDFYGNAYTSVFVSSNGLVGFGSSADPMWAAYDNTILPTPGAPNNLIAALWDDLYPPATGASVRSAFVAGTPNRYVVSWVGVPNINAQTNGFTFQIILEEGTNDIVCQYQQVRTSLTTYGAGRSATIGVEDIDGLVARLRSFNGSPLPLLTNNLALRFHRVPGVAPVANAAPTLATPAAAANTSPVSTTTLSVLGADSDGGGETALTYTWSIGGVQRSVVQFTRNGTNAARDTTATFTQPGTYPLRVTITDAGGLSVTSDVTVTVNRSLATLVVSPATANVAIGNTQQFTIAGQDQFGGAFAAPTVAWTMSPAIGTVNGTGLYNATAHGTATVTATSTVNSAVSGTASVTTANAAPTVATLPYATPDPVTGTTTLMRARGLDDLGEPALTYTWSTVGTVPATVIFSPNGTHAARDATATFTKAGAYTVRVTIADASVPSLSVQRQVTFTVSQTLTSIVVTPTTIAVVVNQTRQFAAAGKDQFGATMTAAPTITWAVAPGGTGTGTINASGLYTAPAATTTDTVTATNGSVIGSATANIVLTGAAPPAAASGGGGGGGGCGLGSGIVSLFIGLLLALRGLALRSRRTARH